MSDEILKQLVNELAEIRQLLTQVLTDRNSEEGMAETKAEIEMVTAMGIDPVKYLQDKSRERRLVRKKKRLPASH